MKSAPFFEEVAPDIHGHTVLLDVDGTLVADGLEQLDEEVILAVSRLKEDNDVYLVTNGAGKERARRLSEELGVPIAPSGVPAGKPLPKAAAGIPRALPLLVIGDKYSIDGVFARLLKVPFVKVRSKRSSAERITVKISYLVENVVSFFL